jgi:hypothetical protein
MRVSCSPHDVGLVFALDRNLMRMYVILLAALLVLGVSCLTAYLVTAARSARKRQTIATRLDAALTRAAQEHKDRKDAASASTALTTVLPVIQQGDQEPRRVA